MFLPPLFVQGVEVVDVLFIEQHHGDTHVSFVCLCADNVIRRHAATVKEHTLDDVELDPIGYGIRA